MTTTPIRFNLGAAQDALARSDYGAKALPGDKTLIDAYEGYCQQEWDRFREQQDAAERADWLTRQCPGCEVGGTGEECDSHWDAGICTTRNEIRALCTCPDCWLGPTVAVTARAKSGARIVVAE